MPILSITLYNVDAETEPRLLHESLQLSLRMNSPLYLARSCTYLAKTA